MRTRELILKDDMGSDKALKILQEEDGDIIISIINPEMKFNRVPEVQFCNSGGAHHKITVFFSKLLNEYDSINKGWKVSNNIDRAKLVEWVESEKFDILKCLHDFNEKTLIKLNDLLGLINSGDFDCEAVKSEWKPERGEVYFTPQHGCGVWTVWSTEFRGGLVATMEDRASCLGILFKTEQACKRYMNFKGWINDKEWEI